MHDKGVFLLSLKNGQMLGVCVWFVAPSEALISILCIRYSSRKITVAHKGHASNKKKCSK